MITISSTTFDLNGSVQIDPLPGTTDGEISRRVSRVATLDGGVVPIDRGFSDGDRTLNYEWKSVSKAHNDAIARILRLYPQVHVSTPSGVFLASPQTFAPGEDQSSIVLLVISKVSE